MPRFHLSQMLLVSLLTVGASSAVAGGKAPKKASAAKAPAKPAKPPPPKKLVPPPSAEHKKKLDDKYADKLKGTTDVAAQDRIRADKKREVNTFKTSFVAFEANKPSPWDV